MIRTIILLTILAACSSCSHAQRTTDTPASLTDTTMTAPSNKSDSAWKAELSPEQYHILREKGTERPFAGIYDKFFDPGTYHCAGCGQELFESDTKFDSGCGWPAFFAPLLEDNVNISIDRSHGMVREEVTCSSCGGHLGHVFNDGPPPTYRRYCINSGALEFRSSGE